MADYQIQPTPRLREAKGVFNTGVQNTWTPRITCEQPGDLSMSYGTVKGQYSLIGDILFLNFAMAFSATFSTATGSIIITGRPHFSETVGAAVGSCATSNVILDTGYTWLTIGIVSTLDKMLLVESGSNQTTAFCQIETSFTSGVSTSIEGQVFYRITGVS